MPIIAFTSQHGGVGTTTSAVTVAYGMAQAGYSTLLVDLQELAQCAFALGLEPAPTIYDWLISRQPPLSRAITIQNGLRLLRGDRSTQAVNRYYNQDQYGREWLVGEFACLDSKSWILIDTPRGQVLGEAVIEAADVIIIPFRGDATSWHGVLQTTDVIKHVGSQAKVVLLPTMFDLRQQLARHYLGEAHRLYGGQVAQPIPHRAAFAQASARCRTIWEYADEGIEEVQDAYTSLINQMVSSMMTPVETSKTAPLQQRIAELEHQLAEAKEWRARHDLQTRMDTIESGLSMLTAEVAELRKSLHGVTTKLDKLRSALDDRSEPR